MATNLDKMLCNHECPIKKGHYFSGLLMDILYGQNPYCSALTRAINPSTKEAS